MPAGCLSPTHVLTDARKRDYRSAFWPLAGLARSNAQSSRTPKHAANARPRARDACQSRFSTISAINSATRSGQLHCGLLPAGSEATPCAGASKRAHTKRALETGRQMRILLDERLESLRAADRPLDGAAGGSTQQLGIRFPLSSAEERDLETAQRLLRAERERDGIPLMSGR